ncbi:MAG: hypothetical protein HYZ65_14990 [Burkholderiales bacterium]|nr:hypothetical protein [Burkholderiales bacterium]
MQGSFTAPFWRRPGALLLVLLLHLALWPVLQQTGGSSRSSLGDPSIHYLQLFHARPAAPQPLRAVRQHRAPRPAPSPVSGQATNTVAAPISAVPADSADGQLDLEALRASARANEGQRKPGEIEQMQAGHWRDRSLEQQLGAAVQKAQRKDCRNAYAGLGLLAIIPLAASTVVDTGCKW